MKLYTYLNFGGNCREAFEFYEKHLGGKITSMMTHAQAPFQNPNQPEGWDKAVLHARMNIGGTELMGADIPGCQPVRSAYMSLLVDSIEEAERVYATLGEGGEIFMPMTETFFSFRFGQLRDKFGVNWMILNERPMA